MFNNKSRLLLLLGVSVRIILVIKMYSTVFFDLDGTVINSEKGILNSVEYALKKYGAAVPERSELNFFLGPPLEDSFAKLLKVPKIEAQILVEYYREYYREKGIFEIETYDGIEPLLEKIKKSGRKTVIATSKPEEFAIRILEHLGIAHLFDIIAGATFDNSRSEKIDVLAYALKRAGVTDIKTAVMVGDRRYDCMGATHFGMDSIGVLYGFGDIEELTNAGATYIAKSVEEIYKFL